MIEQGDYTHIVLDACCIINIAATGHHEAILTALPVPAMVAAVVIEKEVHTFINESNEEIPVDLNTWLTAGIIGRLISIFLMKKNRLSC